MSDHPFGLYIGERFIALADIEKKGGQYLANILGLEEHTVNIYKSEARDEIISATAALVQKIVKDAGIKKKPVNIVIPDSYGYSQIIEMPLLTEKELLSAIKYQADQFIPVPIDKVNLDIEILYEDKKNHKLSLLLAASPNSIIDKIVESVEAAGLAPNALENETSAVLRIISDLPSVSSKEATPTMNLLINFGHASSSLYLFHEQAKIPLQIHNFPLGYNLFLKDIQANFNASETDAKKLLAGVGFAQGQSSYDLHTILSSPFNTFLSEVERFITVAKTRFNLPINTIFIFGEGMSIQSFDKQMSSSLGISIIPLNLYSYFIKNNVVDFFQNSLPLFIPAFGASIHL